MTALIIVLAVLLFLALLPLGCCVDYDGSGLRVRFTAWFLRVTLYPGKEKPKRAAKKKSAQREAKLKKEKEPKPGAGLRAGDLWKLRELLGVVFDALGSLRRSIRVRLLFVRVIYGAEDAATRAIRYGQAWALIGAVTPLLENNLKIRKRDIQAVWDAQATGPELTLTAQVTIHVWQIIVLAARYGWRTLRVFLKMKKEKAVQPNESSSV